MIVLFLLFSCIIIAMLMPKILAKKFGKTEEFWFKPCFAVYIVLTIFIIILSIM